MSMHFPIVVSPHTQDELTVTEKRLISQMADQLQERGQNATSSAVMVRLQAKHPDLRGSQPCSQTVTTQKEGAGLDHSKFKDWLWGRASETAFYFPRTPVPSHWIQLFALSLQESAADLTKIIDQLDARLCKVVQVSTAPPVGWTCIMPRFLEELKAGLQAEGSTAWYLCADFTHTLEIMGFQYGLCSALVAHGFRNYHDVSVFLGFIIILLIACFTRQPKRFHNCQPI